LAKSKNPHRVSIYAHGANPSIDRPILRKSSSYVGDLLSRGDAFELPNARGVQLYPPNQRLETSGDATLQTDGKRGDLTASDATLNSEFSFSPGEDSLGNPYKCHRRAVRLAHQKVVAWPKAHDTHAVTITAGHIWIPSDKAVKARANERLKEHALLRRDERAQAERALARMAHA
jgi:hypothetical protein